WILGVLDKLREIILVVEAQVEVLLAELARRVAGQPRPKALGELSLVMLDAEVCDWNRFHNRKQVGSYTGCCPGEHSSGGKRLVGSIDRMGNGRVRALLVEAVWRFLIWQPDWKAAQRMKTKLASGTAMKKKTVVALARQLAVDLWRWRTGRNTMEELGCPDRSWCVAQVGQHKTKRRHRSGRNQSSQRITRNAGTERKKRRSF